MEECRDIQCKEIKKWLTVLMYATAVRLVNSAVGLLSFVPAGITNMIIWAEWITIVICLYNLKAYHERYRKAMLFYGAMMVCALFSAVLFRSSMLVTAASVFAVLSAYQEYYGHSEMLVNTDEGLSGKWHSLFTWNIVSAVLVGFGSVAAVLIVALSGGDSAVMTAVIVGVLSLPQMVIDLIYMIFIKKMCAFFDSESGERGYGEETGA